MTALTLLTFGSGLMGWFVLAMPLPTGQPFGLLALDILITTGV